MNVDDYFIITNLAKVRIAKDCLRGVVPIDDGGFTLAELQRVVRKLILWEERLSVLVEERGGT